MNYIEPHGHMVSRTTDDYERMAIAGCQAICEPAFWAGFDRASADGFYDYFRQIIASGILKSEDPFFAKSSSSTKKPDNLMTPPAECLKAGEVGFGYMMNGTKAIPNDDPNRVIAVTPLFNGSAKGEFDSGPLDQKAVFVGVDSSVKALTIRQDNKKVVVNGTKTLLENGEGTIWGADITPVIKVPKKK